MGEGVDRSGECCCTEEENAWDGTKAAEAR